MLTFTKYETVIGLEVHIQLNTQSKSFSSDKNKFGGSPNTYLSPTSLGHPGTLPVLNKEQVKAAVKLGLALGCTINKASFFERKNYFYADLPKGYQITQDEQAICTGGQMQVEVKDKVNTIRIHHLHMEEDAGKSIHDLNDQFSLVDLNRAGVPLLEIVTEPDFRSPEEVEVFINKMRQLVRYLGISDGNMQEGSMRFDCNISVREKGASVFGNRCEVKNMNSMKFAKKAISYEAKRQIALLEKGKNVLQQTLTFDPSTGITSPTRSKEEAYDYRYFIEPDLPSVMISDEWLEKVKSEMPLLAEDYTKKFQSQYGLSSYDARLLSQYKEDAILFSKCAEQSTHYKLLANLFINKLLPLLRNEPHLSIPVENIIDYVNLIAEQKISASIAKQKLFPLMVEQPTQQPSQLAKAHSLLHSGDSNLLKTLIEDILVQEKDNVKAYQNGKKKLFGMFMGKIMRAAKGKADPIELKRLLTEKLNKKY